MQSEIYAAIQLEWRKISNEEHRSLIYDYLLDNSEFKQSSWMEFLQAHFDIEERPTIQFSKREKSTTRLKSAA